MFTLKSTNTVLNKQQVWLYRQNASLLSVMFIVTCKFLFIQLKINFDCLSESSPFWKKGYNETEKFLLVHICIFYFYFWYKYEFIFVCVYV